MSTLEAIVAIKAGLKARSDRIWSVTRGRGTASGWITIDAPPARRTWSDRERAVKGPTNHHADQYEPYDTGQPGHSMSPEDRAELGRLLGLEGPAHCQGESIPGASDYYREFIDRAHGRAPSVEGTPYWD
jgi:hypothetical protein